MPKNFFLKSIYAAGFLFGLQMALAAYVNSTYLSGYWGENMVGIIYAAGSILAFLGLSKMPVWLARFGNRRTAVSLLMANLAALAVLITTKNSLVAAAAFLVYFAANTLIIFSLDIFLEHYSSEKKTGSLRGLYLTCVNLAWVISPFLAGQILARGARLTDGQGFPALYSASFVIVIAVALAIAVCFKKFPDASYRRLSLRQTLKFIFSHKNITVIVSINFLLQFFYAWMVVYTPIYLHQHLGFDWLTIGKIFTVMLLPFILFQLPLGRLADKKGEKKILIGGLIIGGLATGALFFLGHQTAAVWAAMLFLTRVGVSSVEVMAESYFFKQVHDGDPSVISAYRDMSPLSYLVAPLLATVLFLFLPIQSLYLILGALFLFVGLPLASIIKDTR